MHQIKQSSGQLLAVDTLPGSPPGVFFCTGFHSTMMGLKADYLRTRCAELGWAFTRFDYRGHGDSDGNPETTTLKDWLEDVLLVLDTVCQGPQIIVGSSMGGWLATLATVRRPDRIEAMVGIASAPDFTEELIWQACTEQIKDHLKNGSIWQMPSHYEDTRYPISMALIQSGRELQVLNKAQLINCPVRLLHGLKDTDVPHTLSIRLLSQISSVDAQLTLVKSTDHRFSTPQDLKLIDNTLRQLRN